MRHAIEHQPEPLPPVTHARQCLDNLLGLVQRWNVQRGDQISFVDLIERIHRRQVQASAQIHNREIVLAPDEGEHVLHLLLVGLLLGN